MNRTVILRVYEDQVKLVKVVRMLINVDHIREATQMKVGCSLKLTDVSLRVDHTLDELNAMCNGLDIPSKLAQWETAHPSVIANANPEIAIANPAYPKFSAALNKAAEQSKPKAIDPLSLEDDE